MDLQGQDKRFVDALRPVFSQRNRCEIASAFSVAALVLSFIMARMRLNTGFIILILLVGGFVGLVISVLKLGSIERYLEKVIWLRFAEAYNIADARVGGQGGQLSGLLSRLGGTRRFFAEFSGRYESYDLKAFTGTIIYHADTHDPISRSYRCFEIATPQNFTNIYLARRTWWSRFRRLSTMNCVRYSIRHNRQLQVEGDIYHYFDIFVPPGHIMENLITLSPEKLVALRDHGRRFDVAFSGNKIHIITPLRIRRAEDILAYQAGIFGLLENIGAQISRNYAFTSEELMVREP